MRAYAIYLLNTQPRVLESLYFFLQIKKKSTEPFGGYTLNNCSNWSLYIKWNNFRIIKLKNNKCVEYRSIVYYKSVEILFDQNKFTNARVVNSIFDVTLNFKSHNHSLNYFKLFILQKRILVLLNMKVRV